MDLESFKSTFQTESQTKISKELLKNMLSVSQHPQLRRIRRQLSIETIAWVLFLALYYNFFDGHLKPVIWNLALILAVVLLLAHNLSGYYLISHPIDGLNIIESLRNYLGKIRKYAFFSIASRAAAMGILFGFFLSGIDYLEPRHITAILLAGVVTIGQVMILWRIWSKRINDISSSYQQFL